MKNRRILLCGWLVLWGGIAPAVGADFIRCASTTSTQNSGLFDHILPRFKTKTGIKVQILAVGTGAALEIGKRGDVDLVFVHAKNDELKMVEAGWFTNRQDVMYNQFVLVGPPGDPAGVKQETSVIGVLKRIMEKQSLFISRGDDSGTHKKEKSLWAAMGAVPKPGEWYLEVGQGMAKTLRIAANKTAYALTDKGTFFSLADQDSLGLSIVFEGDPLLFNQYGVMAVNPKKHTHIKFKKALIFIDWLVSKEGQKAIASFKDNLGNPVFFPNAIQAMGN